MPLENLRSLLAECDAAGERLAREQRWFSEFFEQAADASLITDRYAMIRSANAAAAALLGRARRYLPGKPLAVFVPLAERRQFRRNVAAVLVRSHWTCSAFSVDVRRSPGGLCWALR
jgi:PAS domain S-box-containing protein